MYSSSSRREFLTAATAAAFFAGPAGRGAAVDNADPRVAQVLADTIGVDMHNHVYPPGTEPHPQHGPQTGKPEPPPQQQGAGLALGEELKRSALAAVCASFVLDFAPNNKPGDAQENFLHWLSAVDEQLAQGRLRRALNVQDIFAAHKSGEPTIVQTVEGAMFIEGHLGRIEEVYKRGLRNLQLLHEWDDKVSPLGDVNTAPAHLGGLTPFGADVIKECNRLGILVDLAHGSHETVLGALRITKQPFVVSHTSLNTRTGGDPKMVQMMQPRLISPEHAKVVADAGGIVGVWTHLAPSLPEFVESIKSMVDAIGIDHVGMGTDTDLLSPRIGSGTNRAWPGLTGGFLPAVAGEMLHQGFTPDEIAKVAGGNYCRVFGQVASARA